MGPPSVRQEPEPTSPRPQSPHPTMGPGKSNRGRRHAFSTRRWRFVAQSRCRTPAWRWELAGEVVASGLIAPRTATDPAFAMVLRFRRSLHEAETAGDDTWGANQPAMLQAWTLRQQDAPSRWLLEARLLGGQSAGEIAATLELSIPTIEFYQAAFFDVRDRLDARLWVGRAAIGPRYQERLEARDVEVLLKAIGFYVGPAGIDALLAHAIDAEGRLRPLVIGDLRSAEDRFAARVQIAVAAMTGSADPQRLLELSRLQHLVDGAERRFTTPKPSSEVDFSAAGGLWAGFFSETSLHDAVSARDSYERNVADTGPQSQEREASQSGQDKDAA